MLQRKIEDCDRFRIAIFLRSGKRLRRSVGEHWEISRYGVQLATFW